MRSHSVLVEDLQVLGWMVGCFFLPCPLDWPSCVRERAYRPLPAAGALLEERKYKATFSPRRCHRPPPPAAAACAQRWRLLQHAGAACCSGTRRGIARRSALDIPLRMGSVSALEFSRVEGLGTAAGGEDFKRMRNSPVRRIMGGVQKRLTSPR